MQWNRALFLPPARPVVALSPFPTRRKKISFFGCIDVTSQKRRGRAASHHHKKGGRGGGKERRGTRRELLLQCPILDREGEAAIIVVRVYGKSGLVSRLSLAVTSSVCGVTNRVHTRRTEGSPLLVLYFYLNAFCLHACKYRRANSPPISLSMLSVQPELCFKSVQHLLGRWGEKLNKEKERLLFPLHIFLSLSAAAGGLKSLMPGRNLKSCPFLSHLPLS